jgi:hypothetical protein
MRRALFSFLIGTAVSAQVFDEVRNLTKAGISAYNQRKLVEARQYLSAALDIDSTWQPAVLTHGQVYADILSAEIHIRNTQKLIQFDKFDRAEAELDGAEGIYPTHPKIPELRELLRRKRMRHGSEIPIPRNNAKNLRLLKR